MKCPKCSYLGFETGDRCKNCGYDFSLLAAPAPAAPDLNIRTPESVQAVPDIWFDRDDTGAVNVLADTRAIDASINTRGFDLTIDRRSVDVSIRAALDPVAAPVATAVVTPPAAPKPREASYPLFSPESDLDDEPLIKLPAAPRPPLAVRRTPDLPRFRPAATPSSAEGDRLGLFSEAPDVSAPVTAARAPIQATRADRAVEASGLGRRAIAGLIDHAILLGIDFIVIYSTLRMSALTIDDWALLPAVPLVAFLGLLKLSYFGAFTAACGQTIGKMAMRIRVIADDAPLDPARAARRTLMSAVSLLAAGAGFIPVLVDPEHRALHDRVAGTRVVEVPSA